jgi:hypothetical protein
MAAAVILGVLGLVDRGGGETAPEPPASQAVLLLQPVAAGRRITVADLGTVRLPAASLGQAQITDPALVIGRPAASDLPAGTPLSAGLVASGSGGRSTRDLAVRLDGLAGVPAGAAAGGVADLYLTLPGRRPRTLAVLRDVLVVSAASEGSEASATLRVPAKLVESVIAAEAAGALRLVLHAGAP